MKKYPYRKIAAGLFFAALIILILMSFSQGSYLPGIGFIVGLFAEMIIVVLGILFSIWAVIKEKKFFPSGIFLLVFLIPIVVVLSNVLSENAKKEKYRLIRDKEVARYEKLFGNQILSKLSSKYSGYTYLFSITELEPFCKDFIESKATYLGNGDFLLVYEIADIFLSPTLREERRRFVAHFIPDGKGHYLIKTCLSFPVNHSNSGGIDENSTAYGEWRDWVDEGDADDSTINRNLLSYYLQHQPEIPVCNSQKMKVYLGNYFSLNSFVGANFTILPYFSSAFVSI